MNQTLANRGNTVRRLLQDPTLVTSVLVLWIFLGLFVLYPLAWLLVRTFTEGGAFTLLR